MSITSAALVDVNFTGTFDGADIAVAQYEIQATTNTETYSSVRDYASLPAYGAQFESSGCRCTRRQVVSGPDADYKYYVSVTYERKPAGLASLVSVAGSSGSGSGGPGDYQQNPLSRPGVISGSSEKVSYPVIVDNLNKEIRNSAGDLFAVSFFNNYGKHKLNYQKNIAVGSFNLDYLTALIGTKNVASFGGFDAETLLLDDFDWTIAHENNTNFVSVTYHFLYDPLYYHVQFVLQKGNRYLDANGKLVEFADKPGLLKANGTRANPNSPVFKEVDYIFTADWSSIVI